MSFIRAGVIITMLVSSLGASSHAQDAPVAVVTAVNETNANFVQGWNKHDPAALAALFTSDALFIAPSGISIGQAGVQKYYAQLLPAINPSPDFTHDIDRVEMLSSDFATAVGHWNLSRPALKGFWSATYAHHGDTWAIRTHTYNLNVTTPAAAGK